MNNLNENVRIMNGVWPRIVSVSSLVDTNFTRGTKFFIFLKQQNKNYRSNNLFTNLNNTPLYIKLYNHNCYKTQKQSWLCYPFNSICDTRRFPAVKINPSAREFQLSIGEHAHMRIETLTFVKDHDKVHVPGTLFDNFTTTLKVITNWAYLQTDNVFVEKFTHTYRVYKLVFNSLRACISRNLRWN